MRRLVAGSDCVGRCFKREPAANVEPPLVETKSRTCAATFCPLHQTSFNMAEEDLRPVEVKLFGKWSYEEIEVRRALLPAAAADTTTCPRGSSSSQFGGPPPVSPALATV